MTPLRRVHACSTLGAVLLVLGGAAGCDGDGDGGSLGPGAHGGGAGAGPTGGAGAGADGGLGGGGSGTGGSGADGGAGAGPPVDRYGIGLVNAGDATDHDLAAKLAGPGGYVLVIFADVTPSRTSADPAWKQSIPSGLRPRSDPGDPHGAALGRSPLAQHGREPHRVQEPQPGIQGGHPGSAAARRLAAVRAGPQRAQPLLRVGVRRERRHAHRPRRSPANTPTCSPTWPTRCTPSAIHASGVERRPRSRGAATCQCGSSNFTPGTLSATFLQYMQESVPGVFDKIHVFASHSLLHGLKRCYYGINELPCCCQ